MENLAFVFSCSDLLAILPCSDALSLFFPDFVTILPCSDALSLVVDYKGLKEEGVGRAILAEAADTVSQDSLGVEVTRFRVRNARSLRLLPTNKLADFLSGQFNLRASRKLAPAGAESMDVTTYFNAMFTDADKTSDIASAIEGETAAARIQVQKIRILVVK